jgi:hypothetical protein
MRKNNRNKNKPQTKKDKIISYGRIKDNISIITSIILGCFITIIMLYWMIHRSNEFWVWDEVKRLKMLGKYSAFQFIKIWVLYVLFYLSFATIPYLILGYAKSINLITKLCLSFMCCFLFLGLHKYIFAVVRIIFVNKFDILHISFLTGCLVFFIVIIIANKNIISNNKKTLLQLLITIIGVFIGAYLSLSVDRYDNEKDQLEKYKKDVIALNMETLINATYLGNYKNKIKYTSSPFLEVLTICSENFLIQTEVNKYANQDLLSSVSNMIRQLKIYSGIYELYYNKFNKDGYYTEIDIQILIIRTNNALESISDVQNQIRKTANKYGVTLPTNGLQTIQYQKYIKNN